MAWVTYRRSQSSSGSKVTRKAPIASPQGTRLPGLGRGRTHCCSDTLRRGRSTLDSLWHAPGQCRGTRAALAQHLKVTSLMGRCTAFLIANVECIPRGTVSGNARVRNKYRDHNSADTTSAYMLQGYSLSRKETLHRQQE